MLTISLKINKKQYQLNLQGHETLLEVLRDQLGLTGTKEGCSEAECGACSVLINGKVVLSCITLACDVMEDEITTIEGLAEGENLHPIQEAFLKKGAVQCGFCMPGMILSTKFLLNSKLSPTLEDIQYALDGNICRCAGYPKIFEAVTEAAHLVRQINQDEKKSK